MKDVLSTYKEYLTFCKDITSYLKRPDETMSMANRIQIFNWIKEDKDILIFTSRWGIFFTIGKM